MDYLFPDDHNLDTVPRIVDRDQTWVDKVMNSVHHVPFARVKVMFADLTEDEARAKGYIKGNYKKEQVFKLLKRSTTPTTVYKKQRFDRDDIVDMSTMDVVGFVKKEQRGKLNEELGMAFLIGDGRDDASDDKINELNIRPIFNDDDFYTIKVVVQPGTNANEDAKAKATIKSIIKARKELLFLAWKAARVPRAATCWASWSIWPTILWVPIRAARSTCSMTSTSTTTS